MSSGVFSAFLALGQGLGFIYGGFAYSTIGFRWALDTIAIANFIFALLYFGSSGGVQACKRTFKAWRREQDKKTTIMN